MTISAESVAAHQALYERLSNPQVAHSLATILDHSDLLALLVEGLDQFVARSEVIGDSLVDAVTELKSTNGGSEVDIAALVQSAGALAGVLPQATPGVVRLVESGTADKLIATTEVAAGALDQVQVLVHGLVKGSQQFADRPVEVSGLLSAAKLLKDPDIARALSFFATVAKAVGQELAADANRPAQG